MKLYIYINYTHHIEDARCRASPERGSTTLPSRWAISFYGNWDRPDVLAWEEDF